MTTSGCATRAYNLQYTSAPSFEYFLYGMKLEEEEETEVQEIEFLKKQQRERERLVKEQEQSRNSDN